MSGHQQSALLILGDIHFGKYTYVPELACKDTPQKKIVQNAVNLVDSLVETVNLLTIKPSAILVPGDLTSIASPAEFKGCTEVVFAIADRIGVSKNRVFFTLGNHDTNWRIAGLAASCPTFFADEGYNSFASCIGERHILHRSPDHPGPVVGSGVFLQDDFVLFVLNSGHACISEQTYPHGKLGQDQLSWFESALKQHSSPNKWNVLMVHHHPYSYPYPSPFEDISHIEEGAELIALAGENGIHLICHGHRHHPMIFTQHKTGWAHPVTFLCAGSLGVDEHHRMHGEIPNLFHVLYLERVLTSGSAFGTVFSYRYRMADGWRAVANDPKYTPIDPIQRFGALPTEPELATLVSSIIDASIASPSGSGLMPDFKSLPEALQCVPINTLNRELKAAAQKRGIKFLGSYPEETCLRQ